jgi:hypothetical protein
LLQALEMPLHFSASPGRSVETVVAGNERHPVVVVDGLLAEPESLVEYAATEVKFRALKGDVNYYPGVRAPVPQRYLAALYDSIKPLLRDTFGFDTDGRVKATCSLSMVTVPPEKLNLFQRLPHFDTADPRQLAVLHYFCRPSHGGTSFYRHRATGYESITHDRLPTYLERLREEVEGQGPPPARYAGHSDERFERIASFDAVFNRVLIYRSQVLHSGSINADAALSCDPRVGRLTANAFFYLAGAA